MELYASDKYGQKEGKKRFHDIVVSRMTDVGFYSYLGQF